MLVSTTLPTARQDKPDEFLTATAIASIAASAERAGFFSVRMAEHPFPDDHWLAEGGGHHDVDSMVALSFAASATTTLRLQTSLMVLPYRNPFLTARSTGSLDLLSGGRLVLGVGAGYLEAEFEALGVAFDQRNELTDEAIIAMRRAWTESGVHMTGLHFDAQGHTMLPRPAQPNGPPIWVGGNSKRAIRRAVELGDGWMPMPYVVNTIVSRHTAPLSSLDEFKAHIAYAADHAARIGRTKPLTIHFPLESGVTRGSASDRNEQLVEAALKLAEIGVTHVGLEAPRTTRAELIAELERLGEDVLPQLSSIESKPALPS